MENIVRTWQDVELTEAEFNGLTEAELELTEGQLGLICGAQGTATAPIGSGITIFSVILPLHTTIALDPGGIATVAARDGHTVVTLN